MTDSSASGLRSHGFTHCGVSSRLGCSSREARRSRCGAHTAWPGRSQECSRRGCTRSERGRVAGRLRPCSHRDGTAETRWGRGSRRHPHTPGAGSRWGRSPGHRSRRASRRSTWWWGCWSAPRVPPQQPLLPGMCVPATRPLFVLLILFALSCPGAGCPVKPVQQGQPAVSGVGVAVLEPGRARAGHWALLVV